jgi:hypothetical protein
MAGTLVKDQLGGTFEEGTAGWSYGLELERATANPAYLQYILGNRSVGAFYGGTVSRNVVPIVCQRLTSISLSVYPDKIGAINVSIYTPNLGNLTIPVISEITSASGWISGSVNLSDHVSSQDDLNLELGQILNIIIEGVPGGVDNPDTPFDNGFMVDNIVLDSIEIACPTIPGGEPTDTPTPTPSETPTPTTTGTISPTPTETPEETGTVEPTNTVPPTPTPTGYPKSVQVWAVPAVLEVDKNGVDDGKYVAYIYMEIRDNFGKLHNLKDNEKISLEQLSGPGVLDTKNILDLADKEGRYYSTYSPAFEDGRAQIVAIVEYKDENDDAKFTRGTTSVLVRTILSASELENVVGERPVAKKTLYFRGLR